MTTETGDRYAIDWLLEQDPAIRWQVMRDLLDAPAADWQGERGKVATHGWGAALLNREDDDGQWAGGAFFPAGFTRQELETEGQPWTATAWTLTQLREFGLDPAVEQARRAVERIGENSRWDHDGQPYWDGEVEECINGRTVADGAYYGVDVAPIAERLVGKRLDDGGWNCQRAEGSVRSSFHTTINVLEGLLAHERATVGTPALQAARLGGEEYLLRRSLFRRLSTGEPADPRLVELCYPARWRHDILRGLDYFRNAGRRDERLAPAVELLRARRLPDGCWPTDGTPRGRVWFAVDAVPGEPSAWNTLRALRVLRWWRDEA